MVKSQGKYVLIRSVLAECDRTDDKYKHRQTGPSGPTDTRVESCRKEGVVPPVLSRL